MGKSVLLVDDEEHILELMSLWLDDDPRCGDVRRARTLAETVRSTHAACPDSILLDLRLGRECTASVLPELRQTCPHARILVHTASREDAERQRVLDLGADAILEKATVSVTAVVDALLD